MGHTVLTRCITVILIIVTSALYSTLATGDKTIAKSANTAKGSASNTASSATTSSEFSYLNGSRIVTSGRQKYELINDNVTLGQNATNSTFSLSTSTSGLNATDEQSNWFSFPTSTLGWIMFTVYAVMTVAILGIVVIIFFVLRKSCQMMGRATPQVP